MSSAICFNLDQSKILSSGNGLNIFIYTDVLANKSSLFHLDLLLSAMDVLSYILQIYFMVYCHMLKSKAQLFSTSYRHCDLVFYCFIQLFEQIIPYLLSFLTVFSKVILDFFFCRCSHRLCDITDSRVPLKRSTPMDRMVSIPASLME